MVVSTRHEVRALVGTLRKLLNECVRSTEVIGSAWFPLVLHADAERNTGSELSG